MIINLRVVGGTPEAMRDSINASLAELSQSLGEALVGEIIQLQDKTSGGTYAHTLGTVPVMALFMGGASTPKAQPATQEWTDHSVTFGTTGGARVALLVGRL